MAADNSFLERRLHSRVPVKLPVQYRLVEDPKELEELRGRTALAKDLSPDGLYLKTGKAVKPGDVFRLEIAVPEGSKQLFAFAEVVWADEMGAGLRLLIMESEDEEFLKDYWNRASSQP